MRDARLSVWTNPGTLTSGALSINGPTIDLFDGYTTNSHSIGAEPEHGIGVEVMGLNVVIGNSTAFNITWKWQVAPDSSGSPGTWVDFATIGTMYYDLTNLWTKGGASGAALGLTRAKLQSRLRGSKLRFARLVATAASLSGTGTVDVKAWIADGMNPLLNEGTIR